MCGIKMTNSGVELINGLSTVEPRFNDFPVPTLKRVILKNYKSIQAAAVDLHPLTLVVGPNGSGKSNFLDGVRLTSDAFSSNLENAIRERGGINEVRRRSRGHPTHFGIRLELDLGGGFSALYAYTVAAKKGLNMEVQREECIVYQIGKKFEWFESDSGAIKYSGATPPPRMPATSLALPVMSGVSPHFNRIYEGIRNFGFYSLSPDAIRQLQKPEPGELLLRDGRNLASVIRRTKQANNDILDRITAYLAAVVPGIKSVDAEVLGPMETVEFRQEVVGDPNPWQFLAAGVSDGTLRALGVLTAVFQDPGNPPGIPLVGLEEPEAAIHPGAGMRLMDALLEASKKRQLLITTHSPDLLDHADISPDSVIAVQSERGTSNIGPVNDAARDAIRQTLYTVGELLRLEQVEPQIFGDQYRQLRIFD